MPLTSSFARAELDSVTGACAGVQFRDLAAAEQYMVCWAVCPVMEILGSRSGWHVYIAVNVAIANALAISLQRNDLLL